MIDIDPDMYPPMPDARVAVNRLLRLMNTEHLPDAAWASAMICLVEAWRAEKRSRSGWRDLGRAITKPPF